MDYHEPMSEYVDLGLVAFIVLLFVSIYRKRSTTPLLFWMTGWFFVLLHFFALIFHPKSLSGGAVQSLVALATLILCGSCFIVSVEELHQIHQRRLAVLVALTCPWLLCVVLASLPEIPWVLLAVSACIGQVSAMWLALWVFGKRRGIVSPLCFLILACTYLLIVALRARNADLTVEVILTQCFSLVAILFSWSRRRFTVGTLTVSTAMYAWGAVWLTGEVLARFAPAVQFTPEIWNLPKYFAAAGMILSLLEQEIRSAELASEQYRLLFASNPHPMWMYDRGSLKFLQVNDAAVAHYGYSREQFDRLRLVDVQPDATQQELDPRTSEPSQLSGPWNHQRQDGTMVQVDIASQPLMLDGREVTFALMQDVTERQRLYDQLVRQAHHDLLTGLPNRGLFEDRVQQTLSHAARYQHKSALICLDVDRFKQINDTYGHGAGDLCLKTVAERLASRVRSVDTVARIGGEEFAILLHTIGDAMEAERFAAELLTVLKQPTIADGFEIEMDVSLGIAVFPEDGHDAAGLWRDADTAMYRAKNAGGAQFVRVSNEISASAIEANDVEMSLRRALKTSDFEVHYQPQMTIDGRLSSLEAVVRSRHPLLATMSPEKFIPIAEESGLIVPLGNWVLEEVCRQSRAWINQGLPPIRIAVNVSPRQLTRFDFSRCVMEMLEKYRLSPKLLELEVTESTVMPDKGDAPHQIAMLARLGLQFSVDDFGTGYSSLGRLHQLPVQALKIDRSFIERISEPKGTYPIVQAMIALAHNLGMKVVAEGVETDEQLRCLKALDCDRVQGYLFSRPLPAQRTTEFLGRTAGAALVEEVA